MYPGPTNKLSDWRPVCPLAALRKRAEMLQTIRAYFERQQVMEVETPLLGDTAGTDPHLHFFAVPADGRMRYLQTSPEFAMKRLLAAGSGSIYQICKAFRQGEAGRLHNPEFTLLEWYRVGFDLNQLMADVVSLVRELLGKRIKGVETLTYSELFKEQVKLDWDAPLEALQERARQLGFAEAADWGGGDRNFWLDFLFSHAIQPELPSAKLIFVTDFPAPLAALARLKPGNPKVAERFELFFDQIELANGYQELTNPIEQRQRFLNEQEQRRCQGLPVPPLDEALLQAMAEGLPECSGVALGLDRLLMVALSELSVADVLAFPWRSGE